MSAPGAGRRPGVEAAVRPASGKGWGYLGIALALGVFAAALVALHHLLAEVHLANVLLRFRSTPLAALAPALLAMIASYLALTAYDWLALRHLGKTLPYRTAALGAFTSYAVSHNLGFSIITGGSIRFRIYSAAGLSTTEIATLTAICGLTFALGVGLVLGLALLLEPALIGAADGLPAWANRALGVLLLTAVGGYALASALRKRPLELGGWKLGLPAPGTTLAQIAVGAIDTGFAAATLYFVLPEGTGIAFPAFVGIFVAAMTLGILSHAPGGIGVFEAVVLLLLPESDKSALLGALLIYRCIYYLLPLAVAVLLLSWHEFRLGRAALETSLQRARDVTHAVAPQVLGVAVLAGGALLLLSGATPSLGERLAFLRSILPLPAIEASHLLASVAGLLLLILSRGLFRRSDGALHLTLLLLCTGIVFSLLKGFDYEEALLLGGIALLVLASRRAFYRKASLLDLSFSPSWLVMILMIVGASIWLGLFAYKHVEYSDALWWRFAYSGDAPRFLRASVAVSSLTLVFLLYLLLRPAAPREVDDTPDRTLLRRLVARAPRADANLAMTGDKRFLVSESQEAFLMFQVAGRSWVAMGDPVGAEADWPALLWRYRELCDRHGGWPMFYQVTAENLPLYLDLGLSLFKLGEQARVDLTAFSLADSANRDLRYGERRAAREGAVFEVVPAAGLPAILPELRAVSDDWLASKATHEKRFSVGAFAEDYLAGFDCALVRHEGAIVAFANIWQAPAGGELSIDLMRHREAIPYATMDFLFVQLMLWGKARGYRWFDLGMAPLSGLDSHPLAPVWHKLGAFVFRHGEHFYNFEGLRAYKAKFHPVWTPRYLASPGGLALPRILVDIAALISGGAEGIFRR